MLQQLDEVGQSDSLGQLGASCKDPQYNDNICRTTYKNHPELSDCPVRKNRLNKARHRGDAILMTNSHSERVLNLERELWQPVSPPKRGKDRTAFHAFMLLPGLSLSFYAAALGRSRSSVTTYREAAAEAARSDPAIMAAVETAIVKLSHDDGLQMARIRGKTQLPSWSRLAIGEYRKRGFTRREIATAFRCSPGTVANVLQGKGSAYALFSGERRLTHAQQRPPGQWRTRAGDCLKATGVGFKRADTDSSTCRSESTSLSAHTMVVEDA